jgi:hypothetical protein
MHPSDHFVGTNIFRRVNLEALAVPVGEVSPCRPFGASGRGSQLRFVPVILDDDYS